MTMVQKILTPHQDSAAIHEREPAPQTGRSTDGVLLSTPPRTRGRAGVPLVESLRSSLDSLRANVMRTTLTMLGIIIGVGAVVALLAYGNGVVAKSLATIERNGSNLLTIQGANQISAGVATGNQQNTLTLTDAQALADPTSC